MYIIPVYNMLMLPDTTFYFKKDFLSEMKIEDVQLNDRILFLMLREGKDQEHITREDFYTIGVSGIVRDMDEDGTIGVKITERIRTLSVELTEEGLQAETEPIADVNNMKQKELERRFNKLKEDVLAYISRYQWGLMARSYIIQWTSFNEIAVGMSAVLNLTNVEKYEILETNTLSERIELIEKAVYQMIAVNEVSGEAALAVKQRNEELYREEALKRQIEFLQRKLDEMHPENVTDVRRFEKAIAEAGMNETARKEAEKVLNRMKQEGKDSHEYGLLYDYLDFVTGLEWRKQPIGEINLDEAKNILDEEHFGLKKVKKRIIQQLAVIALNKKQSGSILLFVGAPGTGKTSIGQSIAKALGREYVRISLGGVRDEAEIRGHRRTYVGAMPGRIMDGMKKCGVSNPVMVLDEVDKLARDYNGDPASALLEVLDPEQNNSFTDHYMNVPYDLSDVLFVCTANTTDTIPGPLLDRMELIQFPGYTPLEKFQIAKRHLIPKAKKNMGIDRGRLKITDAGVRSIIDNYTMESGVRGLKKQIDVICRSAAVELVSGNKEIISVGAKKLEKYLDQKPLHRERILEKKEPGVVTGLAWTAAGGEILFIEALQTKGSGNVTITGQLGDVMKESAEIALSLVKKMYPKETEDLDKKDIHIHVPAGAVPKDGPSAGITITTALASMVSKKAVSPEYAMTGEVSLRGNVMPIGGLPEKLMAAERAGIKKVLIPYENMDDLKDVAEEVLEKLEIIPVKKVKDVLKLLLSEFCTVS